MLENGVLARTPWGELAHALAGKQGFERVRSQRRAGTWPRRRVRSESCSGTSRRSFCLTSCPIYLRSVQSIPKAWGQLTAFLTRLFSAVDSTPKAALVYTLAIGKGNRATDAYSDENEVHR